MFVSYVRIDGQCQQNILAVTSNVAHIGERFVILLTDETAFVGEIIVVRIIPGKGYIRVCVYHTGPAGETFIERIVAVHQIDRAVRASEFLQDVVLINIRTSFTAVSEIDCTCRRT